MNHTQSGSERTHGHRLAHSPSMREFATEEARINREAQLHSQIAALSCEVTLNAIRKGIRNTILNLRGKPKSKYQYNQERKRDFRMGKVSTKPKSIQELMYNVEEDICGPAYKTLDVDPSLFVRHYEHASFESSLKLVHKSFDTFRHLERIDLGHQLIGDEGLKRLCQHIRGAPAVTSLHLSGNQLTDSGIVSLADVLRSLHHLRSLNLSRNLITDQGVITLVDRTKYHSGTISQYDLSFNNLGPLSAHHLGMLFHGDKHHFSSVSELRLGGFLVPPMFSEEDTRTQTKRSSDKSQAVSVSYWGDAFVQQFFAAFLQSPNVHKLQSLSLVESNLSEVGIEVLCGYLLCGACQLTELNLSKSIFLSPQAQTLLARTLLLTRCPKLQLLAFDCGMPPNQIQQWQRELLNPEWGEKQRLQRLGLPHRHRLDTARTNLKAIQECYIAQYYLQQQVMNSWKIPTPVRWMDNPFSSTAQSPRARLALQFGGPDGAIARPTSPTVAADTAAPAVQPLPRQSSVRAQSPPQDKSSREQPPQQQTVSLRLPLAVPGVTGKPTTPQEQPQVQSQPLAGDEDPVDAELQRLFDGLRDPLTRSFANQLIILSRLVNFVHRMPEVSTFLAVHTPVPEQLPALTQVPPLAHPVLSATHVLFNEVQLHQKSFQDHLRPWSAAFDGLIFAAKQWLREQFETQQKAQLTQTTFVKGRRIAVAIAPKLSLVNRPEVESLFMSLEDNWSQTIAQDRRAVDYIGGLYHRRLLYMAYVQVSTAILHTSQSQQSSRGLNRRSVGASSQQSMSAVNLRPIREDEESSLAGQGQIAPGTPKRGPKTPTSAAGGGAAAAAFLSQQRSSMASVSGGGSDSDGDEDSITDTSKGLTSARSEISSNSSGTGGTSSKSKSSKKDRRKKRQAELIAQQIAQDVLLQGETYHERVIAKHVGCAQTLGNLGFFLYYLHCQFLHEKGDR